MEKLLKNIFGIIVAGVVTVKTFTFFLEPPPLKVIEHSNARYPTKIIGEDEKTHHLPQRIVKNIERNVDEKDIPYHEKIICSLYKIEYKCKDYREAKNFIDREHKKLNGICIRYYGKGKNKGNRCERKIVDNKDKKHFFCRECLRLLTGEWTKSTIWRLTHPTEREFNADTKGWCASCDKKLMYKDMEKGHIISLFNGGLSGLDNLVPLCRDCNNGKGKDNTADTVLSKRAKAVLAEKFPVRK